MLTHIGEVHSLTEPDCFQETFQGFSGCIIWEFLLNDPSELFEDLGDLGDVVGGGFNTQVGGGEPED